MDLSTAHLLAGSAVSLAATQAALLLLSRGVGLRVHRTALLVGLSLPTALIASYVIGGHILFPTSVVAKSVPGAPAPSTDSRHAVLNDNVYQFLPWELEVRRALAGGRLPLWSDRIDGGSSPWCNPQSGAASPIEMLARLAPAEHHLLVSLALKLLVSFQGAWLLARLLGARRSLALFAGAGFALGGGIMAWPLFTHSTTAAWIPWLVVGSIRLARRPTPTAMAATAVITAILLVSGQPEVTLAGGLLVSLCVISLSRRSAGIRGLLRGTGAAAVAAVLGFALAAPHLLPFAKLLPHTVRYHRTHGSHEGPAAESRPMFNGVQAQFIKGVANPHAYGSPPFSGLGYHPLGGTGYAGLVALAGAAMALAVGTRRCWPFFGFAIGSALMVAAFAPLVELAAFIPLARTVAWTRFLLVASLCVAVCGAVGFTELTRHRRRAAFAGLAAAVIASLAIAHPPAVIALWLGVLAAIAIATQKPRLGFAVLAAVVLCDLVPWANAMLPRGDPGLFYPKTPFMEDLRREVEARDSCRAVALGQTLYPSLLSVYGIDDIRYHNPVAIYEYAQLLDAAFDFHREDAPYEYFSPFGRPHRLLLDFLNVGFVVGGRPKMPNRFEPIAASHSGPLRIWRNRRILPRAFIAIDGTVVDESEVVATVVANSDPRTVVLDRTQTGSWRPPHHKWSPRAVVWSSPVPGHVSLTVKGAGERLLATSLTQPYGWSATANGEILRTLTINHAFLGVVIPPSVHNVTLRFVPPGLHLGLVLFGIAATAVIALLAWPRSRRSKV